MIDEETYRAGQYNIKNTHFINNTGYNGVAINVKSISKNSKVTFNNSTFVDNHALNYGGVIYSNSINTNLVVHFYNCDFSNNTAVLGNNKTKQNKIKNNKYIIFYIYIYIYFIMIIIIYKILIN